MNSRLLSTLLALALCLPADANVANAPAPATFVRDGVSIELSMDPAGGDAKEQDGLHDVGVRFRVTDAESGAPISGLNPIAWLDRHAETAGADCQAKIRSFLSGSLQARPEADLNTYRVLTLNRGGTVSVIDPLLGFGGSKLITLALLGGDGADWALSDDQQTLFVSLPKSNEVVAVDTANWKVRSRIAVGDQPQRVALQPDGAYLWVATATGVSVINVAERREVARIDTAAGERRLAFTADSRFAFATNDSDGTLSVIDVRSLSELRRIATGVAPVALTFSPLANAAYVAHADGSIVAIDAARHVVRDRVATKEGLRSAATSPDGRWIFAVNSDDNTVYVVDASTNRVVQTITAGNHPDQVGFSDTFAYVRSTRSGEVTLIRLSTVAPGVEPDLTIVPVGQVAPEYASGPALPPAITPAPEKNAMLIANPADRLVYYYSEGMAAPMGTFQNYRREPLGVLTLRRNLRETEPGVYATTVQLRRGGRFDVPFLLDSPKVSHCFDQSIVLPNAADDEAKRGIRAERLFETRAVAGSALAVRVRLTERDERGSRTLTAVRDLRVLTFTPGGVQKRTWARHVGDGVYEASVVPPHSGVYYVFLESPSLGRKYRDFPHWVVTATAAETPGGDDVAN